MLASSDYRSAVKALKEHSGTAEQIAFYERKAVEAERLERYAAELGKLLTHSGESYDSIGFRLIAKLIEDRWTPPIGLLNDRYGRP